MAHLASQRLADLQHLLGVQHLVVGLEQPADGGLVDLHLRAADADGAVAELAVALAALSRASTPSMPSGGTALRSIANLERLGCPADFGRQQARAGSAGRDDDLGAFERQRHVRRRSGGMRREPRPGTARGDRLAQPLWPFPAGASRRAPPPPPGPAAAPRAARPARSRPARRPSYPPDLACLSTAITAAAAVVLAPLASSITDTRIGPKNVRFTSSSSVSPAATLEPPMKIAVCFSSSGPRVKIAP